MSRLPPLEPPYEPDVEDRLSAMMPPGVPPILLFRTFARNMPAAIVDGTAAADRRPHRPRAAARRPDRGRHRPRDGQPAGPRAKLQRLFEVTSSPDGLAVELAVRDWSRRDRDVAERLRRVDNRRIGYIRSLFGQFCADENDVEVRSMLAYTLVIGNYFIAAQHGDKTRAQVLQLAIDRLLR